MTSQLALLLLGDGRIPTGGHAHSAGVEAAVADGRVTDEATLEGFVHGRLVTTGLVDAASSAATTYRLTAVGPGLPTRRALRALDAESEARILVPELREASRRLGRQLARAASRCWPSSALIDLVDEFPGGAHQSVALGCVGVAIATTPRRIAEVSVHQTMSTAAWAGVRLLGLDPFGVAGIISGLAAVADDVAAAAAAAATGPIEDLPARAAPLADIAATEHGQWDIRLFAT